MPMIDLTLPQGALKPEAKDRLMQELTRSLLKWEGAPDNPQAASIAWAYVDERPAGDVYVGGVKQPAAAARYRVIVTVPQGALDDQRKAGLVEEVNRLVLAAEGSQPNPQNGLRVWCIIREVPDGNWASLGRIFRIKDIAAFVGADGARVREALPATAH